MAVEITNDEGASFDFVITTKHGSFSADWPGEESSDFLAVFIQKCKEQKEGEYVFNATNGNTKIEYDATLNIFKCIVEHDVSECVLYIPADEGLALFEKILAQVISKKRTFKPSFR